MAAGNDLSALIAMGAGALSFLSPCVLPIFPAFLSFVTGVSFEDLHSGAARGTRRAVLINSVLFILGFSLVFITLGASFSLVGQALYDSQAFIRRVGGVLVILFGLHLAGWLRLPFLMREWRAELSKRPAGYLGAFLVGVTFAAGWTPCVGPILGSILSLAATSKSAGAGIVLLAAYSAGLAIPFLLSALALDRFLSLFGRFKRLLPVVSTVGGIFLILVGALLVTNYFTLLSSIGVRLTPRWLVERL